MDRCEVVVVGAGIIGLAIAHELASRGASVVLLDARGAGLGATQAAAGMLAPYVEGFGKPLLPMAVRSLAMYDSFISRLSAETGINVGYSRTGSLHVALADEEIGELKALAAGATAMGVECRLLDACDARAAETQLTPDAAAALLFPDHGFVAAGDLSAALVAGAVKYGARLVAPARVTRILPREADILVELEDDHLTAAHAIVAAGSWSGVMTIEGMPRLPVRPVRGQLLQLDWAGPPLHRITWGSRCYLVPAGASSLLVGATVEEAGFDERVTVAGVRDLLDAACDLVPRAWQATFHSARVGLRPATPDDMPIIGRSQRSSRLVFATGHFRNGVLLAPLTARLVGDLVLDNREDQLLAATSPQRFGEHADGDTV